MKYIKKISFIMGVFISFFVNSICGALSIGSILGDGDDSNIDPSVGGTIIDENPINGGMTGLGDKLHGIIKMPQPEHYETTLGYILSLLQIIINWFLGILATIALVYVLYCGFCILTAGSDDKAVDKGKKGIKTSAIAIAGIGLSWLIVSFILRLISQLAQV